MNALTQGMAFCNRKGALYCSFRTVFEQVVRKARAADCMLHAWQHTFEVVWSWVPEMAYVSTAGR